MTRIAMKLAWYGIVGAVHVAIPFAMLVCSIKGLGTDRRLRG